MERESFEDEEVARVLNKDYIAIKVDREERPDVDHIYMSICQALTGSGGWPLTIIMSPDKKPFYAGTYFPKRSKWGRPGLIDILEFIEKTWKNERDDLLESSEKIIEHMESDFEATVKGSIGLEDAQKSARGFTLSFDRKYGGFGNAPKFPTPHNLLFLLRHWKLTGNQESLTMVEKTLESMYRGGIYDHIGFGFSRYSTDRKWLVPHFEKMLYDNALLATTYLEAFQATGKRQYAEVASQIFEYVLRDMTSPEGGFYSAEDADSEGVEGKFYVWTPDEIVKALGEKEGGELCSYFGITREGNFEGKNIPNLIDSSEGFDKIASRPMDTLRKKLFDHREERIHPYKDDKILTSWNGLMVAALSLGARTLGNKAYSDAAEKAVGFINDKLTRYDGRLLARYRDGEAAHLAYLDDYAFMVWGLIELYEATFKVQYLEQALRLNEDMYRYFHDEKNGGFFLYGSDGEKLIARPKEVYDSAIPAGNSVAAQNLLRLARLTGDSSLEQKAFEQLETFGGKVKGYPMGYSYFMTAALFANAKGSEIVIAGDLQSESTRRMLEVINKSYLPFSVFLARDIKEKASDIAELLHFMEGQNMVEDKSTAYVCENFACHRPVTDYKELENLIAGRQ